MAGLEIFAYEDLTPVVQLLRLDETWLSNVVPRRNVNGVTAQWDTRTSRIEVDTVFDKHTSGSRAVPGTTRGTKYFTMPCLFIHQAVNLNEVANLRALGSNSRDVMGQTYIDQEAGELARAYGAYLDEYLCWQAMTGTLGLTVGGVTKSVSYSVPAVNTFNFAGNPWSTTSTNIPNQIATMKQRAVKSSGLRPRYLLANSVTLSYLVTNDFTSGYFGHSDPRGGAMREGFPERWMGLDIMPIDGVYSSAGETEEFTTMHVPDNTVYIVPDFGTRWIEMQVGMDVWVDSDKNVHEGWGPNVWRDLSADPATLLLYLRYSRAPVILQPSAIVTATVA